ncbi:MAG: ROK family protein [Clostridia bacterium]|nr:ROK family protein [Clostridia bacterium]
MELGIDIGGTNVKFGVVDGLEIIYKCEIPTGAKRQDTEIVADIITECKKILAKYDKIEKIGIGSPGGIDSENGVILGAANINFRNTPICKMITDATGIPARVGNDANCAVLGELYAGYGREYKNLILITLGTGVGGGIIIDGKPYLGTRGDAGEIGHMIINCDGEKCGCGQDGCLEAYASVTALIKQTKKAIEENPDCYMAKHAEKIGKVSGRTSFDSMRAGCPVGAKVVDSYLGYLAIGIKSIYQIFRPDAIVIGGAISNEGEYMTKPIIEKLGNKNVLVATSRLKNDIGIIGAAKC